MSSKEEDTRRGFPHVRCKNGEGSGEADAAYGARRVCGVWHWGTQINDREAHNFTHTLLPF